MLDRLITELGSPSGGRVAPRAWSLYLSESCRMSLGTKDAETGNPHAPLSLSESCGARYLIVWDDGRISRGFLERRQLGDDPARTLAAAHAAAYDDPDAAQVLGPAEYPQVALHDAEAAAAARGDTELLATRLREVRARVAAHGFRTWSGSFSAGESKARLVSSSGLEVSGSGTSIGWFVNLDGEIGSGFSSRRAEPESEFQARLDRLVELALALRKPAEPDDGGERPVLLHPRVVEEYVLGTLLHHLDGSTVAHEAGHFSHDQFGAGEAVLRGDLSLRLDPLRPLRSGSYRFSVEGVPAARCSFIEAGRLVQPVLDLKYARRLGRPATPLPYGMDALEFGGPESLPLAQALELADGGALVLSVLGVHTQDSASGDFSLSAPQTLRIKGGRLDGRLRATISGNLFELLNSEDLRFVEFEGEHTPGLLFPCRLDPGTLS